MSIQSEIEKGGWKEPSGLFSLINDNHKITILMSNGKVKKAEWNNSTNWIKINDKTGSIIAWKDGWERTIIEKIVDWFLRTTKKGK